MQGWPGQKVSGGFGKAPEAGRGEGPLQPCEAWQMLQAQEGTELGLPWLPSTWELPSREAQDPGGPPPPLPPHLALALCWATAVSVGIRKRMSVSRSTTVFFLVSWDESWAQDAVYTSKVMLAPLGPLTMVNPLTSL